MIDRRIGRIRIRRGTDLERQSIVFPEGELLYTTDNRRVYIGDGASSGGVTISNRNHIVDSVYVLSNDVNYGDIVYDKSESKTYVLDYGAFGELIPVLISDMACCANLISELEALKNRKNELLACLNLVTPKKPVLDKNKLYFVIQPQDISANLGETATFTASAVGPGIITYQWYRVDTNLPITGKTSTDFEIFKVSESDVANYKCVATSSVFGFITSEIASLTLGSSVIISDPDSEYILSDELGDYLVWDISKMGLPPKITTQPISQTSQPLVSKQFSITVESETPLQYQWYKDGVLINGATSDVYIENSAVKTAKYKCIVTNSVDSVESSEAILTILLKPVIIKQPENIIGAIGGNVTFKVVATGSEPLSYQWKKDGAVMFNQTSDTLSLTNISNANLGNYSCVISNAIGSIESNSASLSFT